MGVFKSNQLCPVAPLNRRKASVMSTPQPRLVNAKQPRIVNIAAFILGG